MTVSLTPEQEKIIAHASLEAILSGHHSGFGAGWNIVKPIILPCDTRVEVVAYKVGELEQFGVRPYKTPHTRNAHRRLEKELRKLARNEERNNTRKQKDLARLLDMQIKYNSVAAQNPQDFDEYKNQLKDAYDRKAARYSIPRIGLLTHFPWAEPDATSLAKEFTRFFKEINKKNTEYTRLDMKYRIPACQKVFTERIEELQNPATPLANALAILVVLRENYKFGLRSYEKTPEYIVEKLRELLSSRKDRLPKAVRDIITQRGNLQSTLEYYQKKTID